MRQTLKYYLYARKKNSASSSLYGQSHLGNFLLLLIILYHWVSTLKTILDLVKPFAVLYLNIEQCRGGDSESSEFLLKFGHLIIYVCFVSSYVCPFTGPKIFYASPNFLCRTKNLFTYCASHKHFVPEQKMICIQ